jgi:hypothetical protein
MSLINETNMGLPRDAKYRLATATTAMTKQSGILEKSQKSVKKKALS